VEEGTSNTAPDPYALAQKKAALLAAGTRANTQQAYLSDLRHFEQTFGGVLPATPTLIEDYLTRYSDELAPVTLQRRLAALSAFHRDHGYPDPTKTPQLKQLMKGIRSSANRPPRQARPLGLRVLRQLVAYWDGEIASAAALPDPRLARQRALLAIRDKAFYLIGFWCGFRSDELVRLAVHNVQRDDAVDGTPRLKLYLPYTKGDRAAAGHTHWLVALPMLCPVAAYLDWIAAAFLDDGAVFRAIDRWGNVGGEGLHSDSVIKLMRAALVGAGVPNEEAGTFSSHSLRRGFATEWSEHGGALTALMQHVGWKNPANAAKYIEPHGSPPLELMQKWLQAPGDDIASMSSATLPATRAIAALE
jgi:integrase